MNGNLSLRKINSEMKSLIKEIEQSNHRDLKNILNNLRLIAQRYRHLELESVGLVKKTSSIAKDVCHTAQSALGDGSRALTPKEAVFFMSQDFDSLGEHLTQVIEQHTNISHELKEQAEFAMYAKHKNDACAARAVEMKSKAKFNGLVAIPGVALVAAPVLLATELADTQNHPLAKVAAGVGGAVSGICLGLAVTVYSPMFAIVSGVYGALAQVFSHWSANFKDLTQQILEIEKLITTSTQQLAEIKSFYRLLGEKVSHYKKMDSKDAMAHQFGRIIRACADVIKSCDSYLDSSQRNEQEDPSTERRVLRN